MNKNYKKMIHFQINHTKMGVSLLYRGGEVKMQTGIIEIKFKEGLSEEVRDFVSNIYKRNEDKINEIVDWINLQDK